MATTPAAVNDTVNFTAFTAANPSVATAEDASVLAQGDTLTLAAVAGDPAAMTAIDGKSVEVGAITGNDVSLVNLDLTGLDVTALAGTGTVTANAPAPSPSPPDPPPEIKAEQLLTDKPSPGVGTLPVPGGEEDTLAGTRFEDDPVPDPENPTGPPLSADKVQKLKDAMKAKREQALSVMPVVTTPPPAPAPAA